MVTYQISSIKGRPHISAAHSLGVSEIDAALD